MNGIMAKFPRLLLTAFKGGICLGGWILLGVLAWHFRGKLLFKMDSLFLWKSQKAQWEQLVQARIANLREVSWKDGRPLIVMLGDSQIEMGAWYDLFQGRFAVRNVGLSRAKIADVARLAKAVSGIKPEIVVLMCGVNDLGTGGSVDTAAKDYGQLLEDIRSKTDGERILVLSIMPVAWSRMADGSVELNARIKAMNVMLLERCNKLGIKYLDVAQLVSAQDALREDLTWDGLHLNPLGYRILAGSIEPALAKIHENLTRQQPDGK